MPDAVIRKPDEQKTADILRWCAEAGFPVSDVRLEHDVLVLVPQELAALPDVQVLQRLAQQIQTSGHRYVALAVEPEVIDPDA